MVTITIDGPNGQAVFTGKTHNEALKQMKEAPHYRSESRQEDVLIELMETNHLQNAARKKLRILLDQIGRVTTESVIFSSVLDLILTDPLWVELAEREDPDFWRDVRNGICSKGSPEVNLVNRALTTSRMYDQLDSSLSFVYGNID